MSRETTSALRWCGGCAAWMQSETCTRAECKRTGLPTDRHTDMCHEHLRHVVDDGHAGPDHRDLRDALDELDTVVPERDQLKDALVAISAIRDSIIGTQRVNWSEHIYPLVAALDKAGYPGAGYETARANAGTLLERLAAAEAERDALREVAEAARPFVPTCDEDVSSDENGHGLACGKTATHHSRMGGNNIGYLCDEHTELAHAAAVRAASKGWSKAIDLEAPSTFDADPIVRDLAAALTKVPR